MPRMATPTEAWPVPGRSTTITLGAADGADDADAARLGKGEAGAVQSPNAFCARAKPASGSMSPASTSVALSGR